MQPKGIEGNVIHAVAGAVEAGRHANRGGVASEVLGGKAAGRSMVRPGSWGRGRAGNSSSATADKSDKAARRVDCDRL